MKTLLAAFILFFSTSFQGHAESILTPQDRIIAKDAERIKLLSSDWIMPVNIHAQHGKEEAQIVFDDFKKHNNNKTLPQPDKKKPGGRVLIFASTSLGESSLEDLFSMASDHKEAVVVFRGVIDEKRFAKSIMAIQKFAARQSPVTNTALDPTLFIKYNITLVPTIVYLDQYQETEVARVAGLSNPKWLLDRVNEGEKGDMGTRGPVEEIAERDLIEVMKEKMATIDWNDKKEKAINNFWKKQKFIHLPRAKVANTRHIDPSILITEDINDADGNAIILQGTKINPLEMKPFTQAVVVFDPLDKIQVELIDKHISNLNKEYSTVTIIVTQFDKDKGWAFYKSITDHFDKPVFKLTSDIVSRFELNSLPVIITADNNNKIFIVKELAQVAGAN